MIERAVLVCRGDTLRPQDLDLDGGGSDAQAENGPGREPAAAPPGEATTLRDMEKNLIFSTLKKVKGNRTKASEILGISVRTMRNKLNEYKLEQNGLDLGAEG